MLSCGATGASEGILGFSSQVHSEAFINWVWSVPHVTLGLVSPPRPFQGLDGMWNGAG